MRSWFPLADYDFWGYLASGGVLAYVLSAAFGSPITIEGLSNPLAVAAVLAASYTLGHANAAFASWLFESLLVGRVLGAPVSVMIGERKIPWIFRLIAPSYRPMRPFALSALRARLKVEVLPTSEELFQRAYHYSRGFSDVRERLDQFRNQYGFCRNAALAVIIAGAAAAPWVGLHQLAWIGTVCLTTILLIARYLKFYRLFANEILNTFIFREID